MALETEVFQQDPFSYGFKDLHADPWSCGFGFDEEAAHSETLLQNGGFGLMMQSVITNSSSSEYPNCGGCFTGESPPVEAPVAASSCRRKRRRTRSVKNKEEVENQRMTHIFVERNRRKQMNDHLSALRSLMPTSYVQRGDQASIVGGAINYVKELEQLLQTLEVYKRIQLQQSGHDVASFSTSIFSDFFSFPQYATSSSSPNNVNSRVESKAKKLSAVADIEVTMAEGHANIKILSRRYPKQLFKMVTGFHSLGLNVLHLNVTTFDHEVLYTFSVKVEEDCQLRSVNEIAAASYEMMGRVQEEAAFM